jgi:hypothetical protein
VTSPNNKIYQGDIMDLTKLRQSEFDAIKAVALSKFKKSLGDKPTMKQVRKTLPNPFTVNALEVIAFVLLIVLTIFTSIKVGLVALPFVDSMVVTLSQHSPIDPNFTWWFKVVGIALFIMLATPGLIYFKLLSDDPKLKRRIEDTAHYRWINRLSLNYITPRLPSVLVYFTVAWMVFWSSQLPGTVFEQYLGVVAEVALAQLVGTILAKRAEFERAVTLAWKTLETEYNTRLENYESDKAYLRQLYLIMREQLIHLTRKDVHKKPTEPNLWLLDVDDVTVDRYVEAEYRRLTSGSEFATRVTSAVPTTTNEVATSTIQRITPPDGVAWTMEQLYDSIRSRGFTKYTRTQLRNDYAPKYGTEQLWSNGLKEKFE